MTTPDTPTQRKPIILAADEGEAIWFNNDLLTFKATGAQTQGSLLLAEELARQGKVTPLHTHAEETESFYVLEGEAVIHVDGAEYVAHPGSFVSIPPGVPHAYLVTSETARSLVLISPGDRSMEAFFREAGEPARDRGLPAYAPLDIQRIAAAAELTGAVQILGPPPFGDPGSDR